MRVTLKEFYAKEIKSHFDNPYAVYAPDSPVLNGVSPECVYFLYNPLSELYKIGISTNPYKRLSAICAATGCDCRFLIVVHLQANRDEPSKVVERIFHQYFKPERKNGEWFELSGKQVLDVCEVLAADVHGWAVEDLTKDHYRLLSTVQSPKHMIGAYSECEL